MGGIERTCDSEYMLEQWIVGSGHTVQLGVLFADPASCGVPAGIIAPSKAATARVARVPVRRLGLMVYHLLALSWRGGTQPGDYLVSPIAHCKLGIQGLDVMLSLFYRTGIGHIDEGHDASFQCLEH